MRKYRNIKKVKKYNYLSLKKNLRRRFKRKRNIDKDGDIIMKENYKYDDVTANQEHFVSSSRSILS